MRWLVNAPGRRPTQSPGVQPDLFEREALMNLNERAWRRCERLIEAATELRVEVHHLENGSASSIAVWTPWADCKQGWR